ncbi:MAG: NfeD family protein, partial [Cohaesibacter sp.]|nr:NfeD family protein [Cohaesibacter sp.]
SKIRSLIMPLDLNFIEFRPEQWSAFGGALFAIGHLRKWKIIRAVGIGALATGLASWAMEHETPTLQIAMFLGCSYLAWRSSMRRDYPIKEAGTSGRQRVGLGLIGRNVQVSQAIENGKGKVMIGFHEWDVTGPDVPLGSTVKVMAQMDSVLKVAPLKIATKDFNEDDASTNDFN